MENKRAIERMIEVLEFLNSRPIGGPSGNTIISRMYLHAVNDILEKARALAAEEKAQDKKCQYYGDGIQSDDQCPGAVNTRNCPENTDEDCNISMRPPASLVEEWALSKIGGAQVGYEKEIAAVCGNELKTILSRYAPQESIPDRVEELKKCLLGLSEQKLIEDNALVECLEILSRFTPQESLAELAYKKGRDILSTLKGEYGWMIEICERIDGATVKQLYGFKTYAEAEANAREWLNGLPDAKTP